MVPLVFKVIDRIDTRFDADLAGWRRTVSVVGLLVGMGLVITFLMDALCALLGWPVKGIWPEFMF